MKKLLFEGTVIIKFCSKEESLALMLVAKEQGEGNGQWIENY